MEESLSGRENPQQDQTGDDVTGDSGADFFVSVYQTICY